MALKYNPFTGTLDIDTKTTDAESLRTISISTTAPTDDQVLTYNSASEEWEPQDLASSGIGVTNGADNVIVRFNGTDALQGYTSNAPTVSDTGIASFPEDDFTLCERIGASSNVTGVRATAFGNLARAAQDSLAMGYGANGQQNDSVCIGSFSVTGGIRGVSIGRSARCESAATSGVAIGYFANAEQQEACAIGQRADAQALRSFALGSESTASSDNSIAIGYSSEVETGINGGISIGNASLCSAVATTAIGNAAQASGNYSLALGNAADNAGYALSIAMGGLDATNTSDRQMVIGGSLSGVFEYWFGSTNGRLSTGAITKNFTFNFPAPSGTDTTHTRDFELNAPAGTGTGECGSLKFRVALPGSTGSTANTHTDALEISPEGEVIHSFAVRKPITTLSSDTTLDETHYTVLVDTSGGDVTITLPTNVNGRIYNIKKITSDANIVSLSGTIDGVSSKILNIQYESITIQNETTNWWIL